MKILVISHMYPSRKRSVYGIFVHKHIKALINQGCEVKVVSPVPYVPFPLKYIKQKWREYDDIPKKDIIEGVEVYYPRYIDFPKSLMFGYSGYFMYLGVNNIIKKIYKDWKFDIIHSHVGLPDGFAGMLANRHYKLPHIITIHGQDFQRTIYKGETCKKNLFKALETSNKIITVSTKLKNIVDTESFSDRVAVINNGIDLEDCANIGSKIDFGLDHDYDFSDENTILSVSNLVKTKGIDLNIKAVSLLITKYPNIKYLIIGDGPERESLKNLAYELDLKDNVLFLGKLPHEDVMKYMSATDIFCLPSWEEGFGVVYIEAMAHGKPTIGVKGEGIEDAIVSGKNGFLVNPHNEKDVADTIGYLLSNKDKREEIGQKGKDTVINRFTWEQNANKTINIYRELLKSK